MVKCKEMKEWEEKVRQDATEVAQQKQAQKQVARAAVSLRDENNEELDYYDDLERDMEMASSQETAPMSS